MNDPEARKEEVEESYVGDGSPTGVSRSMIGNLQKSSKGFCKCVWCV